MKFNVIPLFQILVQGGIDIFSSNSNEPLPKFQSILREVDALYLPERKTILSSLREDTRQVARDVSAVLIRSNVLPQDHPREWAYPILLDNVDKKTYAYLQV